MRGVAGRSILIALIFATIAPIACAPTAQQSKSSQTSTSSSPGARSQLPDVPPDAPGKPTATITATDPCAERLHSICGPLLFHYALHRRLPEKLEQLRELASPGDPELAFTCPVTNRPYVYLPQGVPRGNSQPGQLILFDAAPTHSGMRWAVAVDPPRPGQPLVTKVVAEPETTFHTGK